MNQNYNANDINHNSNPSSSINTLNANVMNSSNKPSSTTMNQHPVLTSNLIQNNQALTVNNNSLHQLPTNDQINETDNLNKANFVNLNNSTNNLINNNLNNSNNSINSDLLSKSPYTQMSILEKNSNQLHQQPQSNNLIANNPILNNLITNNTISTNLVQNNFIQLNPNKAKNISITNGYINETTTTVSNQSNPQQLSNNSNQTYIESNSLNPSKYQIYIQIFILFFKLNEKLLSLSLVTISPITSLNRLNSGKSETVVILTTNQIPNSANLISTNTKSIY